MNTHDVSGGCFQEPLIWGQVRAIHMCHRPDSPRIQRGVLVCHNATGEERGLRLQGPGPPQPVMQ